MENEQKVIDYLNRIYKADPVATQMLTRSAALCTRELADDPAAPVHALKQSNGVELYLVSPLGILNGLLVELGLPLVAAKLNDKTGALEGFMEYAPPPLDQ